MPWRGEPVARAVRPVSARQLQERRDRLRGLRAIQLEGDGAAVCRDMAVKVFPCGRRPRRQGQLLGGAGSRRRWRAVQGGPGGADGRRAGAGGRSGGAGRAGARPTGCRVTTAADAADTDDDRVRFRRKGTNSSVVSARRILRLLASRRTATVSLRLVRSGFPLDTPPGGRSPRLGNVRPDRLGPCSPRPSPPPFSARTAMCWLPASGAGMCGRRSRHRRPGHAAGRARRAPAAAGGGPAHPRPHRPRLLGDPVCGAARARIHPPRRPLPAGRPAVLARARAGRDVRAAIRQAAHLDRAERRGRGPRQRDARTCRAARSPYDMRRAIPRGR